MKNQFNDFKKAISCNYKSYLKYQIFNLKIDKCEIALEIFGVFENYEKLLKKIFTNRFGVCKSFYQ